jgi:hypothetical protein
MQRTLLYVAGGRIQPALDFSAVFFMLPLVIRNLGNNLETYVSKVVLAPARENRRFFQEGNF